MTYCFRESSKNASIESEIEHHSFKLMVGRKLGRIFSRGQLMDSIYSDNRVVSDRAIDSHIKKLRKKLALAEAGDLIHSVYSVGYKLQL